MGIPIDLRIDVAVVEPGRADPTTIAFDERGRLFVYEFNATTWTGISIIMA